MENIEVLRVAPDLDEKKLAAPIPNPHDSC